MDSQEQTFQHSPPQGEPLQSHQSDKMMYIIVGIIIATGVFGGYLALANWQNWWPFESEPEQVLCTQDAMLCPDGSYVGRIGPNCEFAECPVSTKTPTLTTVVYKNDQYGFTFSLPISWNGYSIITDEWEGYTSDEPQAVVVEKGPMISIRHPQWTSQNPRQDIPILVLTLDQWFLVQGKFQIGAAPIIPNELGRNSMYVFAIQARYNYAFPKGYEEVEEILKDKPLQVF